MGAPSALLLGLDDGIETITINRPEKLNALNEAVIEELTRTLEACRDNPAVRAVILTGAGDRAFVAGADIAALAACDPARAEENSRRGQDLTLLIEGLGKPVIAAINGFALGGGCELVLACTLRVASENAKLGQPEVKLGLLCGYGGTQRLPRLVGKGRALELLITGEAVDAAEALRLGLVNRVVKREDLMTESRALARKVLAAGPEAVAATLRAVHEGADRPLAEGLRLERELFRSRFGTAEMKEGTSAFLEKRAPNFGGR